MGFSGGGGGGSAPVAPYLAEAPTFVDLDGSIDSYPLNVSTLDEGSWYRYGLELIAPYDSGIYGTLRKAGGTDPLALIDLCNQASLAPNTSFSPVQDAAVAAIPAVGVVPGFFYVNAGEGPVTVELAVSGAVTQGVAKLWLYKYVAP